MVSFGMLGVGEILIMLLLNGGFYYPMGVPPAPEDPLMAQVAPEKCLFYTTWSGVMDPDVESSNHTEKLLAEAEIQQSFKAIEEKITALLKQSADGDPRASMAAELVPKWVKHLLTHPAAMYLESIKPGRGPLEVNGAAIVGLGDRGPEVKKLLEDLQRAALGDAVKKVEIGDASYFEIHLDPNAPVIHWGVRGRYLVIGFGSESVKDMFANVSRNKKDGLPKWLANTRKDLAVDRFSTVTYANIAKIVDAVIPVAGGPPARDVITKLGFGNLTSYSAVTGLDKEGFVNRSIVGVDGKLTGVMKLAESKPLTAGDLKRIPYDAPVAMNVRLDVGAVFDMYIDLVKQFNARFAEEVEEGLQFASRSIDVNIRDELIGSLGDRWTIYTAPSDGGLVTGWTATVSVRDSMTLDRVHHTLIGFARASLGDFRRAPKIKRRKFGDYDLYCFSVPDSDMPFLPTWCVTKDEVIFGLFPQAVKSHISRGAQVKSLAEQPEVAKMLEHGKGPLVLSYFDTKQLFEVVYPIAQMGLQFAFNQAQKEGIDLDISLLPSAGSISKHLQPSVTAVHRTNAGIESASHSTIPSGNIASSTPVLVALLLPAVQSARSAARRMQSTNNLKQIAISLHNFHDTYRMLPAAFSTDKDGKPLLSWRVHILPFLEQAALYEEFHLDEPWDSEHNIKLLDKMPQVFRSPNSRAATNKTTYLAIGGEKGCFRAPPMDAEVWRGKGKVAGTSFRQITDGLSNTIFGIEANDSLAVEWTKPVEFKTDPMKPLRGILGMFPNGFNAMMGDGAIYFLPDSIDNGTLKKLFEKDDGERMVDIPRY